MGLSVYTYYGLCEFVNRSLILISTMRNLKKFQSGLTEQESLDRIQYTLPRFTLKLV